MRSKDCSTLSVVVSPDHSHTFLSILGTVFKLRSIWFQASFTVWKFTCFLKFSCICDTQWLHSFWRNSTYIPWSFLSPYFLLPLSYFKSPFNICKKFFSLFLFISSLLCSLFLFCVSYKKNHEIYCAYPLVSRAIHFPFLWLSNM